MKRTSIIIIIAFLCFMLLSLIFGGTLISAAHAQYPGAKELYAGEIRYNESDCRRIVCPVQQPTCEKHIKVKLSQTSYTLNVWKHVRNAINAVEMDLPVSCQFYDQVQIGDDLLKTKFRWGSLVVHGSFGTWNMEVIGK